jgi:PAS domain S-box-containing protein
VERQKALIERIAANTPAGWSFLDRDFVLRWMNPAYERFLDRDTRDQVGRPVFEARPELREDLEPLLRRVLESGEPLALSGVPYQAADGAPVRWGDFEYVPIPGPDGEVEGVLAIVLDVTDRFLHARSQQARIDQLREVDRVKDEFLAAMRRELRSPIEGIVGFATILEDGVAGPVTHDQRRFLARILQYGDGLLATVDELLEMSRLQAGEFELAIGRFRFPAVAAAVVGGLMPLARARGQRIVDDVPPDLPPFQADGPRVALALRHLVGNAFKFAPEGSTVTIRATQADGRLRCEVIDQGPGLAAEDLPRLFRPFTQLAAAEAPRVGGVGLGLTIVKAIVDAHGGEVGVESTPGAGSTFWFELPDHDDRSALGRTVPSA